MKRFLLFASGMLVAWSACCQIITDFEGLLAPGDSVVNGSEGTTEWVSGAAGFSVLWNEEFSFWAGGWALSSVADDTTSGVGNLYGCMAGGGHRNSETFAVGQNGSMIRLEKPAAGRPVRGLYVTNTTYAHNSMRDGDQFAKAFGGPDGTDPDFFELIIRGYRDGQPTADSVSFFLADYRFAEDSLDYLVDDWQFVDLLSLGPVDSLVFSLASSDVGDFGINTPAFYAIDDVITAEPETAPAYLIDFEAPFLGLNGAINRASDQGGFDQGAAFFPNNYNTEFDFWSGGWALSGQTDSVTSGFANALSAVTGSGQAGSLQYAVGQQNAVMKLRGLAQGRPVQGLYVTNTTYAHNSMRDGDQFAKAFGGPDGTDPDFFRLTIRKYLNGNLQADSVVVMLADYRFEDDAEDFILDTWTFVDLQELGPADSLLFTLASSDVGDFGINTPLFFAIDRVLLFDPATQQGLDAADPAISSWATGIDLVRGPTDLADPMADTVSVGSKADALGVYDGRTVSLGDGGQATLTFAQPIRDGAGADFVIFENGFPSGEAYFLELAVVEVSSDGAHFVRFPVTSLTDTTAQISTFGVLRPENLFNLAGRFPGRLGTLFDLAELRGLPNLDVDAITHVRVIDVVGSIDPALATYDEAGRAINDPYPTDFPSGGFDLDAVGVIHAADISASNSVDGIPLRVWPNPTRGSLAVQIPDNLSGFPVQIVDQMGRQVGQWTMGSTEQMDLDLSFLPKGVYLIRIPAGDTLYLQRVMKQ